MSIADVVFHALSVDPVVGPMLTTPAKGKDGAVVRIYPLVLPEDVVVFPAISYHVISAPQSRTQTSELARPRIRLNCWGSTYAQSVDLSQKVVAALNRRQLGATVASAVMDAWSDQRDPDSGLYWRPVEFLMWTEEAV
jgi:hypothetical protein